MENKDLQKIDNKIRESGLSYQELELLLKSAKCKPIPSPILTSPTKTIYYGYISDTHIGHNQFDEQLFLKAIKTFNDEKVDFVLHAGDHIEGLSGRPGNIYELSHIGFTAQTQYCIQLYSEIKAPIYGIDGNHDEFFNNKSNIGVTVGLTLSQNLKNYTHLGIYQANLLVDNLKIRLFHATDGTGVADSAKLQKLISLTPPSEGVNIIHSGHYHKALYLFRRGIHGFECGTFMGQSNFMRGNKLESQKGFGLVKVKYNSNIESLTHTFFPSYY